MGSGGYFGPPIPPIKPFNDLADELSISGINGRILSEFSKSCGIVAIMELTSYKNFPVQFIKDLNGRNKNVFIDSINKVNSSGLGLTDIVTIVTTFNNHYSDNCDLIPDMRYNSHKRDLFGTVFHYWHRGITALKFNKSNDSHWIYFGYKDCRYGNIPYTVTLLKDHYPGFDGLGHTVVFRTKGDIEALENTHSNPCDRLMCGICGRQGFCFERKLS